MIDPGKTPLTQDAAPDRGRISRSAGTVRRGTSSPGWARKRSRSCSREIDLAEAEQGARRGDGQHEEQTDSQETREASEARAGLCLLACASRMDGARSAAGHSAGSASARSARRRPFCDLRSERSLSPRHQPQQPAEEPAPAQDAGRHHPQRKAHVAGSGRRARSTTAVTAARSPAPAIVRSSRSATCSRARADVSVRTCSASASITPAVRSSSSDRS